MTNIQYKRILTLLYKFQKNIIEIISFNSKRQNKLLYISKIHIQYETVKYEI